MESFSSTPPRPGRIFFGWYIVLVGFLIMALGYGSRYSLSVFFPTLFSQFGWPRDLTASIFSTHILLYGFMAPFSGYAVNRFGARRSMLVGTVLLAAGLAASGRADQPWQFYLTFGLLAGAGLCLIGSVPITVVLGAWFERRRGAALSLIFFGEGIAYSCYPAVSWMIDRYGWRQAFLIEGLIILVVFAPLIALFLHSDPADKGWTKDGLPPVPVNESEGGQLRGTVHRDWNRTDWRLGQAAKTPQFYLICLSTFCTWGLGHHIVVTHQIAFCLDVGFDRFHASAVLSWGGLTFALGALASVVSDRIGREWTITLGAAMVIASIVVFMMITGPDQIWSLYFYSILFGFGFGILVPAAAAAAGDIFHGPKSGSIMGFIWFSFALGGAVGPWLAGVLFEGKGDYNLAFGFAALVFAAGSAAVWLAAPRKVHPVSRRVKM